MLNEKIPQETWIKFKVIVKFVNEMLLWQKLWKLSRYFDSRRVDKRYVRKQVREYGQKLGLWFSTKVKTRIKVLQMEIKNVFKQHAQK